jgi:hypothetical protein
MEKNFFNQRGSYCSKVGSNLLQRSRCIRGNYREQFIDTLEHTVSYRFVNRHFVVGKHNEEVQLASGWYGCVYGLLIQAPAFHHQPPDAVPVY